MIIDKKIKKIKKNKEKNLEKVLNQIDESMNSIYELLDVALAEYKDINRKDDVVLYAEILQEMAKEMGKEHIDFMGMS